jgi:hypothetical protein
MTLARLSMSEVSSPKMRVSASSTISRWPRRRRSVMSRTTRVAPSAMSSARTGVD